MNRQLLIGATLGLALITGPVMAGDQRHPNGWNGGYHGNYYGHGGGCGWGCGVGAGLGALALGGLVAGALAVPQVYYAPPPVYYAPPPTYYVPPPPQPYYQGQYQPCPPGYRC